MWEYAEAEHIARDYDEYFAFEQSVRIRRAGADRHFTQPGVVVDLAAGTGRALLPLARRGFHGVAVDLSAEMLAVVGEKAEAGTPGRSTGCWPTWSNCDCLADGVADYGVCCSARWG